jgi:hypothetical protein
LLLVSGYLLKYRLRAGIMLLELGRVSGSIDGSATSLL